MLRLARQCGFETGARHDAAIEVSLELQGSAGDPEDRGDRSR
jgi:hypothetical protein